MQAIEAPETGVAPEGAVLEIGRALIEAKTRVVFGEISDERFNNLTPKAQVLLRRAINELAGDVAFGQQTQPHLEARTSLEPQILQAQEEITTELKPLQEKIEKIKPSIKKAEADTQRYAARATTAWGPVKWYYQFQSKRRGIEHRGDIYEKRDLETQIEKVQAKGRERLKPLQIPLAAATRGLKEASEAWILEEERRVLAVAVTRYGDNSIGRERLFRNWSRIDGKDPRQAYDSVMRGYRDLVIEALPTQVSVISEPKIENGVSQVMRVRASYAFGSPHRSGSEVKNGQEKPKDKENERLLPLARLVKGRVSGQPHAIIVLSEEEVAKYLEKEAKRIARVNRKMSDALPVVIRHIRINPTGPETKSLEDRKVGIDNKTFDTLSTNTNLIEGTGLSQKEAGDFRITHIFYKKGDEKIVVLVGIFTSHKKYNNAYGGRA